MSHWYDQSGNPRHFVPKKDGTRNRQTTIADARKQDWIPSVTTILQSISKPQLERWKMIQAATAVLTSPRIEGEQLDAFMDRVLFQEKEQDQEAKEAANRGSEIHTAFENLFLSKPIAMEISPWVMPAYGAIILRGDVLHVEKILVGNGYAGMTDLILDAGTHYELFDFKSAKTLPIKGAWPEHRLQCSAYAQAFEDMLGGGDSGKPIRCGNVYISTVEQGKFSVCEHEYWEATYQEGFKPLVSVWCWMNNYWPTQ